MPGEAKEKCAVAAIVATDPEIMASALTYESLFAMQHRGAEASGMVSQPEGSAMQARRANGMVHDIYRAKDIKRLSGSVAMGWNRYSTSGSKEGHPGPFVDKPIHIAFAENGNLPVTEQLETHLQMHNIHTNEVNDMEMMGLTIAQYVRNSHSLPDAVRHAYPLFRGAFSCIAMQDGLVTAFRDKHGIRPLAIGEFEGGYAITSETCGLDIIGATYIREVEPGEMVIVTPNGIESQQLANGREKLDIFEMVYFARHDSVLYGQRVNEVRKRFGQELAEQHPPTSDKKLKNTLVVPVPDTSVPAAQAYAKAIGAEHEQAIIKNRYIGRTFMAPAPQLRNQQLRRKHNIIPESVIGRDLIFIDDSIVRMNTIPRLVKLAYLCGAKSVSVLVHSPPVRFPDFYGVDTPKQGELAAANMNVEQMRKEINCHYLGFLSLSRMVRATGISYEKFNLSCFNGEYPIGVGHHKSEIAKPVSTEFMD